MYLTKKKLKNSWLEGLHKCIEDEVKAKMDAYCRKLTQKLTANMKQRNHNMDSSEKSANKHQTEHHQLSESLSGVYSSHRHETLEFQRRFTAANSAWLEETTSNVASLATAAQNAFTTHLDESNTTRDEMHALQRDIDEFKQKVDERHKQASEKYATIMDALGKLVAFESETKSLVDARLADWSLRHSEMSRRSKLGSERAHEEAAWIQRQCDELESALRESNETIVRSSHNQIVDLNLRLVEQAELVSKSMRDNYEASSSHFAASLKSSIKVAN